MYKLRIAVLIIILVFMIIASATYIPPIIYNASKLMHYKEICHQLEEQLNNTWITANTSDNHMTITIHTNLTGTANIQTKIPHLETKTINTLFSSQQITYLTDIVKHSVKPPETTITIPIKNGTYNVTLNITTLIGTKQYNITLDHKHIENITGKIIRLTPQNVLVSLITDALFWTAILIMIILPLMMIALRITYTMKHPEKEESIFPFPTPSTGEPYG